jgi:hypothetical protein
VFDIAIDDNGVLYVADARNHMIRKVTLVGSGALTSSDFSLSVTGGTATFTPGSPTAITAPGVYILTLPTITNIPDGAEVITVKPANGAAIYNSAAQPAAASQSNNTVTMVDKAVPVISSVVVAADNSEVTVTFSEPVFTSPTGGVLTAADFKLSVSSGTVNQTPTSISSSGSTYTLGLGISGLFAGTETLTVDPASNAAIYDGAGHAAPATQGANTNNQDNMEHTPALIASTSPARGATGVSSRILSKSGVSLTFNRLMDHSSVKDTSLKLSNLTDYTVDPLVIDLSDSLASNLVNVVVEDVGGVTKMTITSKDALIFALADGNIYVVELRQSPKCWPGHQLCAHQLTPTQPHRCYHQPKQK